MCVKKNYASKFRQMASRNEKILYLPSGTIVFRYGGQLFS